jgi:hypothetical protein
VPASRNGFRGVFASSADRANVCGSGEDTFPDGSGFQQFYRTAVSEVPQHIAGINERGAARRYVTRQRSGGDE